ELAVEHEPLLGLAVPAGADHLVPRTLEVLVDPRFDLVAHGHTVQVTRALAVRGWRVHNERMGRFLLSAMPFTGHVTPISAVADELVRRGHEVRIHTGSRFRDRVERVGARLVPWDRAPDFDENDLAATFPRLQGRKGPRQLFANLVDCFIGTAPAQS